jgi:lipoprotein-anchoring transpeptidase ErfK/SrfK
MRVVSIIATSILIVGLAACGQGGGPSDLNLPSTPTTTPVPTARTAVNGGAVASTSSPSAIALPAVSLVARARVARLAVYDSPGAAQPVRELTNPWLAVTNVPSVHVAQVFLIDAQQRGWVEVLLPIRPNGSAGWVRASDVTVDEVPFAIRVDLRARTMTVFSHGNPLWEGAVAVGAPATPTPTGRYYIRMLLTGSNPKTVFGRYAFGLSSSSNAITGFAGGDAEIGIHGNDDPSSLGLAATLGSIRMPNAEIAKLAALLPLGTPVNIEP